MGKEDKFRLEKEDSREDRELRGYVVTSLAESVQVQVDKSGLAAAGPASQASQASPLSTRSGASRTLSDDSDSKVVVEQPAGRQSGAEDWVRARGEAGSRSNHFNNPRNL